jgi:putative ABC transport system permease protein
VSDGTLIETLERYVYAQPRFSVLVLAVFAVAGMLLVAVGVYSVMAYTVMRQTRELAVRVALGAQRSEVCLLVLRRSAVLVAAGVAIGLIGSVVTGRVIAAQLWHTSTSDPLTFAVGTLLVVTIAFVASFVPARRALKITPMAAMRE